MKLPSFLFLFFLASLLSSGLVLATPPFQTTGADYLQILTPAWDTVKQGQNVNFYWHVFNLTNYLTNATVECSFHLYSIEEGGEHIVIVSDASEFNNNRDFEVKVDGRNFTKAGEYRYLIECKTPKLKDQSYQVGGVEEAFKVTPTGKDENSILNSSILLILGLVGVGLIILGLVKNLPWFGFIGSIMFILLGIYTMIYGFNNTTDLYTQGVAITFIGIGFIFMLTSAYEQVWGEDEHSF